MNLIAPKNLFSGTLFAALLAFSSCGGDDGPSSASVRFADTNLKSKICEALGKPTGAFLTGKDLVLLENLEISEGEITNLSGLEYATQLTKLKLGGNKVTSVFPLAKLTNLTNLDLSSNRISGVSKLAKLKNLTNLNLSGNQIADVAPLAKLTNLTSLDLSQNRIVDAAPLAKLTKPTSLILVGSGNGVDSRRTMLEKALPNCIIQFE